MIWFAISHELYFPRILLSVWTKIKSLFKPYSSWLRLLCCNACREACLNDNFPTFHIPFLFSSLRFFPCTSWNEINFLFKWKFIVLSTGISSVRVQKEANKKYWSKPKDSLNILKNLLTRENKNYDSWRFSKTIFHFFFILTFALCENRKWQKWQYYEFVLWSMRKAKGRGVWEKSGAKAFSAMARVEQKKFCCDAKKMPLCSR